MAQSIFFNRAKSLSETPRLRSDELAANAALSLLNLSLWLLKRQIDTKADRFQRQGGFSEHLYRIRTAHKNK